jgi:BirA family biotin operon repressor/biotin-[acetyl-CoA-carboxylase] ligase
LVNKLSAASLKTALRELALGGLRFYASTGSTNDQALAWAAEGAQDLSLVCADEQTAGRGRDGRRWSTPPGSALAFSLILRPNGVERELVGRFSGLGALALVGALQKQGVAAQIKWPNDVLINEKKTAGILVETVWLGEEVESVILGMGVNVEPGSVPPLEGLNFPATCVQTEGALDIPRLTLLKDLLLELISWRASLASDSFLRAWEAALAFRERQVRVWVGEAEPLVGQIIGLETDGGLRVRTSQGEIRAIRFGEVHLRPL